MRRYTEEARHAHGFEVQIRVGLNSGDVVAVLAARIDRLSPEDKARLQTASVVGKDVPLALLKAIARLTEDELPGQLPWATLLRRVFAIAVLVCPRCAGPRRIVDAVTEPHAVRRLLGALGLAAQPPPYRSVTAS